MLQQLDRPDAAAISKLIKRATDLQNKDGKGGSTHPQISVGSNRGDEEEIYKFQHEMLSESLTTPPMESGRIAETVTTSKAPEDSKSENQQTNPNPKSDANSSPDNSTTKKGRK